MSKKAYLVPDWLFKAFLVLAAWLVTVFMYVRVGEGLFFGRIESWGGRVFYFAESPDQFAFNLGLCLFASLCLTPVALASLGFIPPIGRIYKKWYIARVTGHCEKHRTGGE